MEQELGSYQLLPTWPGTRVIREVFPSFSGAAYVSQKLYSILEIQNGENTVSGQALGEDSTPR